MTAEQRAAVISTIRWVLIRRQFEGRDPLPADGSAALANDPHGYGLGQIMADVDHSELLQRLLDGKEPLPAPPPLCSSYPWYDLIERGYALAMADFCHFHHRPVPSPTCAFDDLQPGDLVSFNGSHGWEVVGRLNEHSFEVRHERAPGRWRLTFVPDATFGGTAMPYRRNGEEFYGPIRGDGYVLRRFEKAEGEAGR
jgi:hypothetical protein